MKLASCVSLFILSLLLAGSSNAQTTVQLSDNYNVSANSNDVNFQITRQTGTLAPITYSMFPASAGDYHHQVGNSGSPNRLLLAADSASNLASISPNQNFDQNPGPGGYNFVRFDVDPVTATSAGGATQTSWAAVTLGTNTGTRNAFVNATNGFGILFRGNGLFVAFDGATQVGTGTYTGTPTGLHPIEVRMSDPIDGDPWNGVGSTLIDVYADSATVPFFSFTKGGGGYTDNFLSLQGDTDNSALTIHDFDNLVVGFVSTPEPVSFSLWLLTGMFACLAIRSRVSQSLSHVMRRR